MPFDHFGRIAGFYDRAAQFSLDEPFLGLVSPTPESIVLDAGGGTGRVAAALRHRVRKVVVADLSIGMLRYAAGKDLTAICTPAEHLPFPAGTFDRVIMMDALHHVLDQKQTAGELWRVLAPGGRLLIVEPDIHRFAVKLIALGEKLLLMRSHFLSGEKISALFEDQNAQVRVVIYEYNVTILVKKKAGK